MTTVTVTVELPIEELRAVQEEVGLFLHLADPDAAHAEVNALHRFRAACRDTLIPRPIQVGDRVRLIDGDHVEGTVLAIDSPDAWVNFEHPIGRETCALHHLVRIEETP